MALLSKSDGGALSDTPACAGDNGDLWRGAHGCPPLSAKGRARLVRMERFAEAVFLRALSRTSRRWDGRLGGTDARGIEFIDTGVCRREPMT